MIVSIDWLKQFVDVTETPDELAANEIGRAHV